MTFPSVIQAIVSKANKEGPSLLLNISLFRTLNSGLCLRYPFGGEGGPRFPITTHSTNAQSCDRVERSRIVGMRPL